MSEVQRGIGNRVKRFREQIGYDGYDVLSVRTKLPVSTLQAIEEGRYPLSLVDLTVIARAMGAELDQLVRPLGHESDPAQRPPRFRKMPDRFPVGEPQPIILDPDDARLLSLASQLSRAGAALRSYLHDHFESPIVGASTPLSGPAWEQGFRLGQAARVQYLPEQSPITNVQGAMEAMGVHVALVQFHDPEIEGASVFEAGALPVILLNRTAEGVQDRWRRRALIAHEFCHILHDFTEQPVETMVSHRGATRLEEQRANAFAPSFLAPQSWVRKQGDDLNRLVRRLVDRWMFTVEGACWHAKNILGLTLEETDAAIKTYRPSLKRREVSEASSFPRRRLPWLDAELNASDLSNGLISELAWRAWQAGVISLARAQEIWTIE